MTLPHWLIPRRCSTGLVEKEGIIEAEIKKAVSKISRSKAMRGTVFQQAFRGLINVFTQKFRQLQLCSQEDLQKFHQLKAVCGLDLPEDFDNAPLRFAKLRIVLKTSFLSALESLIRDSCSKSIPPRKSEFATTACE